MRLPRRFFRSLLRFIWRASLVLAIVAVVFFVASYALIGWTDEGCDDYAGGVILRDSNGEVMRVTLGEGDVDCRPFYQAERDDWIVKALVAVEDRTYFSHCGVRPLSMLRALWQNLSTRRRISGASTITMQAVRLIRPHPKTLWWKWKEAIMALKMERAKSKEWILSQYLNRAPYGSNFIGIEAAAQGWFGKSAKSLGPGEAAMLAGMVQAPSRFRPDRGYEKALKRRDYVLDRMLATGVLDSMQCEAARAVRPAVCRAPRPFKHPFYCDWVMLSQRPRGGDCRTALDPDVQACCDHVVNAAAKAGGYAVSAVVMRVDSGDVVALSCSGDYFDRKSGQVNTALAPRPAGSTLKPFLLALAMDRGLVTPEQRLADVPTVFKGYRPANFDAKYRGSVTARDALILSLNVPFVRLLRDVGLDPFEHCLRDLGFRLNRGKGEFGLGLAIGNADVTLMELVGAYARLGRCAANPVSDGVFSSGAGYLVADILSGTERSSAALGHIAAVELPRFAWKTGTSSAYRDAWTVLWNPQYVVGVWCGHLSGGFGDRSLVGAKAAAPVAWSIARRLYPQNDSPWFVEPSEVIRREVCTTSGCPSTSACPKTESGRALRGRSSNLACALHRSDGLAAAKSALVVSKPEDGARFVHVRGGPVQRVVCQAVGVADGVTLWWFVDGAAVGETVGHGVLAVDMPEGEHLVSCSAAEGETSSSRITVVEESP